MADQVSIRKGTAAELATVVAVNGELGWDETNKRIRGFDGVKAGGYSTASTADLPSSSNPLPVNAGGTNSTTAAAARSALGAAQSGDNSDLTSFSNLNTITMVSAAGTAGTSNKIVLFGATPTNYGIGVSPSSLDIISNAATSFYYRSTLVGQIMSTGLNSMAIGQSTPAAIGATTLSTTGLASLASLSTSSATISGGAITGTTIGATGAATIRGTTVTATTSFNMPSYTVATLPAAGTPGRHVFCSNARMMTATAGTLEASGSGSGGLVTDNGTAWKLAGFNITASA